MTNHQSAIRVPAGAPVTPDFSIDRAVQAWVDRGAPATKLVLGIPYYGQGWTGVTGGGDGLFQPAAGPAPATCRGRERGLQGSGRWPRRLHGPPGLRAGHAWLFDGTTFWTFDDPSWCLQKTAYIREGPGRRDGLGAAGDDANATLTKALWAGLRDDDPHDRR